MQLHSVSVTLIALGFVLGGGAPSPSAALDERKPFVQPISGTALSVELIPVASLEGGGPLWFGKTEIPWEVLDVCVYGFDKKEGSAETSPADAVTRPTKPYIATDRGFGHAGWPANSISFQNAKAFCEWLSAKTGRKYRLPTVAEWQNACKLGKVAEDRVAEFAWFDDNSDGTTHKVASKSADAQGLHDLHGNLAEWCVEPDGTGSVLGGSYREASDELGCDAIEEDTPDWNLSDPQIPRSIWWLADAGWIGFRIVCEGPEKLPASPDTLAPPPATAPAKADQSQAPAKP